MINIIEKVEAILRKPEPTKEDMNMLKDIFVSYIDNFDAMQNLMNQYLDRNGASLQRQDSKSYRKIEDFSRPISTMISSINNF